MEERQRLLSVDPEVEAVVWRVRRRKVLIYTVVTVIIFLAIVTTASGYFCYSMIEPTFELARFKRGVACSIVSVEQRNVTNCSVVRVRYQMGNESIGGTQLGWLREKWVDLNSKCYSSSSHLPPCFNPDVSDPPSGCNLTCWYNPKNLEQFLVDRKTNVFGRSILLMSVMAAFCLFILVVESLIIAALCCPSA